jgi:RNA polymerase sigma-70 factor (ECF subfamily)
MLEQAITNRAAAHPHQEQDHAPHRVDHYLPTEDPDVALVRALRSRTATAFNDLVKRHERRLLSAALRITRNREDAEDVVQGSFLNVFRHLDSFRGDSQFATWLTRITINQALMKIRGIQT